MDLRELTTQVEQVSRGYAAAFGIDRSSDWLILKLHEDVGELTQAHLMREGQARTKGLGVAELEASFAAELADVICQALLIGSHHGVDVQAAIDEKWLSRLPER